MKQVYTLINEVHNKLLSNDYTHVSVHLHPNNRSTRVLFKQAD